jgi:predicted PurR-regulated permease PerM
MEKNQERIEQIAGLALIGTIVACCIFVPRPFVLPILLATILCFATWPLYELLLKFIYYSPLKVPYEQ